MILKLEGKIGEGKSTLLREILIPALKKAGISCTKHQTEHTLEIDVKAWLKARQE